MKTQITQKQINKIIGHKYENDTLEKRFETLIMSPNIKNGLSFKDACYLAYGQRIMDEINANKN